VGKDFYSFLDPKLLLGDLLYPNLQLWQRLEKELCLNFWHMKILEVTPLKMVKIKMLTNIFS